MAAEPCVCELAAGQPSPWGGYLFSPLSAQLLEVEADRQAERSRAEVAAMQRRGLARVEAVEGFCRTRQAAQVAALERCEDPPWYQRRDVLFGAGWVGGVLTVLALVLTVGGS